MLLRGFLPWWNRVVSFWSSSAVEGNLLTNIWWYSSDKLTPSQIHAHNTFFLSLPRFLEWLFFFHDQKKSIWNCPPELLIDIDQRRLSPTQVFLFHHVSIEVCSFFNTFGRCAQLLFMAIAFGLDPCRDIVTSTTAHFIITLNLSCLCFTVT